jgi:hypothetical protein
MIADAGRELERALRADLAGFAGSVGVDIVSRPWASITFSGASHRLVLRLAGPGARAAAKGFLCALGDRDFALRGHVLADIAATDFMRDDGDDHVRLTLEALTVEEED